MIKFTGRIVVGAMIAAGVSPELLAQVEPPDGFVALASGHDLTGWWGLETEDPRSWQALSDEDLAQRHRQSLADIESHWRVEDGVLVNDGQGLYLTTIRQFGDFELLVDFLASPGADSGIYLRGIPQVQIWDWTEAGGKWAAGADKGSGGLWNNGPGVRGRDPLVRADRLPGEWNRLRIVMVGERVTVLLNDQLVVDHARLANYFDRTHPLPRTGPIQLQTHGGVMRWRNVFIREIQAEEANEILRRGGPDASSAPSDSAGADGFETVFNGTDFTGWSGPTDSYEIEDGALRCRPRQGGTIYTDEEYDDFEVRLELRLPPGGNNGLAIRYPGEGDTAYVGMCELQVLDNTHPRHASLDPRQFHGSAYGQVAAARGYLRTPGTWNFQQVTVRGSRIRVELNGTVIMDADLSAVTECLYPVERFAGRGRAAGHFGFAGHNEPVEFRRIEIRRLGQDADAASAPD